MATAASSMFGDPPAHIDLEASQELPDDIIVAVLAVLATVAVIFRFALRKAKGTNILMDDWFILVALIGEYGTAACTFTGNHFGAGKHVWATEPASLRKMFIALYIYPWLYVIATVALKLSFCWTYMRIFTIGRWQSTLRCRNWLDTSLVTCIVASFLYMWSVWLPMTVACRPLNLFWDRYVGDGEGKCMDYLLMWILTGIFSAALDLIILLIPIPKICSLQINWKKKVGVIAVLAIGSFVVIAAVIRLVYMSRMIGAQDFTWALGPAQIWTSLEPSLGIVSSCLIVTHKPLINGLWQILGLRPRSSDGYSGQSCARMDGLKRLHPKSSPVSTVTDDDEERLFCGDRTHRTRVTTSPHQESNEQTPSGNIEVQTSFVVSNTDDNNNENQ